MNTDPWDCTSLDLQWGEDPCSEIYILAPSAVMLNLRTLLFYVLNRNTMNLRNFALEFLWNPARDSHETDYSYN